MDQSSVAAAAAVVVVVVKVESLLDPLTHCGSATCSGAAASRHAYQGRRVSAHTPEISEDDLLS